MGGILIRGGKRLFGRLRVSGAKNAVLPIIAASLLAEEGVSLLEDVPVLTDVETMVRMVESLGGSVHPAGARRLHLDCRRIGEVEAPYELVRKMRASFLVLGPLLARVGRARIPVPGGCAIGSRPVDLHLKGMAALGADIVVEHGLVEARAGKLTGTRIYLDFPSVGATENIMMAACLARGTTVIENAACEPEIVDLATFLNAMGAKVTGAGTKVIKVEGVSHLRGADHMVIPDRIEAGTFMAIVCATGGTVHLENVVPEHVNSIAAKLLEMGAIIEETDSGLIVQAKERPRATDVKTLPYPGFPTDMQPQAMAVLSVAEGTSVITEAVFESRFVHAAELNRMGADISIEGRSAVVRGVPHLTGAEVRASDLRAGAALIIAGLVAEGETLVLGVEHINRGYEDLVGKLASLGAEIRYQEDLQPAEIANG